MNTKIIIGTIIAALVACVLFLLLDREALVQRAEIAEGNFNSLNESQQHLTDGFAKTLQLSEAQFEESQKKYVDSLNKVRKENIKLKHITDLTKFELSKANEFNAQWKDSTKIVHDTIPVLVGKKIVVKDSCLTVELFEATGSDTVTISTKLDLKGGLIFYKGKRVKQVSLFKLKLFRYGKRVPSAQMVTNCNDAAIRIENIQVIK
jgi:hypothetical protein